MFRKHVHRTYVWKKHKKTYKKKSVFLEHKKTYNIIKHMLTYVNIW